MKRLFALLCMAVLIAGATVSFMADFAGAEAITVDKPFHFRDNRSANTVLMHPGDALVFGALIVIPNGYNGTAGSATQGLVTTDLEFTPYTVAPNFFIGGLKYDPGLTGEWTLNFTNGPDTASIQTPSVGTVPKLPFATSVAVSGSSATPTFTWTFPESFTPDGVKIQIWDLENQVSPNSYDLIHSIVVPGDATSYTIPPITSGGITLEENHLYSLEIAFVLTHGEEVGDLTTILTRSRSFFNFQLMPEDSPPNVSLPMVVPGPGGPAYSFTTTVDAAGQTIYVDPVVAIGYEYARVPVTRTSPPSPCLPA